MHVKFELSKGIKSTIDKSTNLLCLEIGT